MIRWPGGDAWVGLWAAVGLTLLGVEAVVASPSSAEQTADAKLFDEQFRPLLVRYCVKCHGGDKPKGKLRLENVTTDFADAATLARWTAVIERLEAGEMPPKGKPRPPAQEIQALTGWLAPRVAAAESAARAAQGRVILRRLNRVEYENTIRDLLGINVKLKEQLPEDGSADGFDNAGAANHTSSFLMEKYLEAADKAMNLAIANRLKPPTSTKKRWSIADGYPVRGSTENVYRRSEGRRGGLLLLFGMAQRRGNPVLPDGRGRLSIPHLGLRLSKCRQTRHLSRDGNRHAS